ncbi:NtaA/DmoA family FMN-dependent monooxygenase [Macrococcoides canis]|uniref:NtaA/DmoA family FMN-dependent monooxygenase n=1 Tax=Macrococcoides canis TaxID=1855823 RepID=UPI0013E94786|nr:NtaA/DmoA family FMN-dependent monooxygenase [Macrococcus canis]QIH75057.1 NtaA/DmoA family FMN-dependent monooxygenase [Macrococcus canis]
MTINKRDGKMKLALQMVSGYGGEFKTWRMPGAVADAYTNMDYYVENAKMAEKGKIHTLFIADTPALANDISTNSPMHPMDPTIALTAVARETKHIGIVSTYSTTYTEPYNLARTLKTLDVVSNGRMGWNAVTTSNHEAAANFGQPLPDRDTRYKMAHEHVEAVQSLWGTFGEEAYIHNKETGEFVDMSQVKLANYNGKYYQTRGPLPIPASPQGQPPIFQAGGGEKGLELAGRFASGVYANPFTKEDAKLHRMMLRKSAEAHGRNPDDIKMFAGFMFSIGKTKEEALERRYMMQEFAPRETAHHVEYLGHMVGISLSVNTIDITKPLPQHLINQMYPSPMDPRSGKAFELLKSGMSVKDVLANGVINYHPVVVGTPEMVADFLEEWYLADATDGFSIVPDSSHDGVKDFVELVVPILQERGLFHTEYEGETLRENLGVSYEYGLNH